MEKSRKQVVRLHRNATTIKTCVTLPKQKADFRYLPKVLTSHKPHQAYFKGNRKGEFGRQIRGQYAVIRIINIRHPEATEVLFVKLFHFSKIPMKLRRALQKYVETLIWPSFCIYWLEDISHSPALLTYMLCSH